MVFGAQASQSLEFVALGIGLWAPLSATPSPICSATEWVTPWTWKGLPTQLFFKFVWTSNPSTIHGHPTPSASSRSDKGIHQRSASKAASLVILSCQVKPYPLFFYSGIWQPSADLLRWPLPLYTNCRNTTAQFTKWCFLFLLTMTQKKRVDSSITHFSLQKF